MLDAGRLRRPRVIDVVVLALVCVTGAVITVTQRVADVVRVLGDLLSITARNVATIARGIGDDISHQRRRSE